MTRFLWNLRFQLALLILPGGHRHVSVRKAGEPCWRCDPDSDGFGL